jgi:hypothetical protein
MMMQGNCVIALKFQILEKRGRHEEWKPLNMEEDHEFQTRRLESNLNGQRIGPNE